MDWFCGNYGPLVQDGGSAAFISVIPLRGPGMTAAGDHLQSSTVHATYAVFSSASPNSSLIAARMMNFCALPVTVSGSVSLKRT